MVHIPHSVCVCVCVCVCVRDKKMKQTTEEETVQQYNTIWPCGNVWFFSHGAGMLISVPRTVTDRAQQEKNRPATAVGAHTGQTKTITFNPIHTYIGIHNKGD